MTLPVANITYDLKYESKSDEDEKEEGTPQTHFNSNIQMNVS